MPSGRVRWFDAKKGFGFITNDEGEDVFLPAAALPDGVTTLRKGARVEFSVIDGRKGSTGHGCDAGRIRAVPWSRRPARSRMIWPPSWRTLSSLLDSAGNELRRHRYPSAADSRKLATLLRGVADSFDVQE